MLSERAKSGPKSGIREMFELAKNYDNVINLGIGEPSFNTLPNVVDAAKRAMENGFTKYTSNAGILELRESICNKLINENGLKGNATENIIVTTGAGEAIMLALLAVTNPGDEVILPDPYWPNYQGQLHLAGAKLVSVKCYEEDKFHVKASSILKAINKNTKAVILNSPSNPTGAVMSRKELEEIASIVKENDLVLISDEPYEKFIYDNNVHFSIGSFDGMENNVITINSFSKTYAMTGWRVGYAHGPKEIIQSMVRLQENISSCVNSPSQYACIEALNGPQGHVDEMLKEYNKRRKYIFSEINKIPGLSCIEPEGAFYAFINIKETGYSSSEFAKLLLREVQVVTTPGDAFGTGGEGYLRISYGTEFEKIKEGIERIKGFLR